MTKKLEKEKNWNGGKEVKELITVYVRVGSGIGGANARIRLVLEAREVFNL